MLSVQPGLRGSNDLRIGRKNGDLSIVFFSRVGVRTYQHPYTIKYTGIKGIFLNTAPHYWFPFGLFH